MNHSSIVSFLWSIADLLRDSYRRGEYQEVILPLTVLRRLDCVLAPTKDAVLETQSKFKGKLEDPGGQLRRASGFASYNTSQYDFEKLVDDAPYLAANLRNYVAGFSENMREVIEKGSMLVPPSERAHLRRHRPQSLLGRIGVEHSLPGSTMPSVTRTRGTQRRLI